MFKYNLKIAWRNLWKDRQFTLLNLVGLATGLACAFLIYLWVNDERDVDRFNEKESQLFQVMQNSKSPNGIETTENTPGLLSDALVKEMPEVEYATSVIPVSWFDKKGVLSFEDNHIQASEQFVGKDYFNVFSYPLTSGNKNLVLANKNSIVISDSLAGRLFNSAQNSIGKTVTWNQKDFSGIYLISGVFKKPPPSATAQFDILFNYQLFVEKNPKLADWRNSDPATYLILKKGTHLKQFNIKIAGFIRTKQEHAEGTLFVQKYADKYLHNHYENGVPSGGRIAYVRLFSLIAVFILIMACVNFMNLSTAKAERRWKEAGIKKVMGAARISLFLQYLGESLLMVLLSLILAVVIVIVLLGQFNVITGKQLSLHFESSLVLPVLLITLLTGLLAGCYPALYLSGFRPAVMLKGKLKHSLNDLLIRKGLVIFQFTLSAGFIVSVLVIHGQMQLIQTKNLGYNRDHLLYFEKGGIVSDNKADYAPGGKYETDLEHFLQQVRTIPGVMDAANFRHNITNRNGGTYDLSWPGKDPNTRIDFTDLGVGYHFIETLGIQLKEGRAFSRAYSSEKSKIIFNEVAIDRMGLKNPIGKTIHLWGEDREIIGVVKNFNFQSLYEDLKPCFFDFSFNQRASKIIVKIKGGMERETIAQLEKFYQQDNQGLSFEYRFLDDDYQALYSSERRITLLSKYFAGLAIIISCLGLFGLSAFSAQSRQKEIGIRKVVGASVGSVFLLLSKDFLQLLLIASLIAFPLSYWEMNQRLHGFAYHVHFGTYIFLIAGSTVILITLFSIGFQIIKAAFANPVNSLRSE